MEVKKRKYIYSELGRKSIIAFRTGKKHSSETLEKIRKARALQVHPMLGKKHSEEVKRKIRENTPSGQNSPHWKGGLTPLTKKIRYSYQYRQWRCDVFTRDSFACQHCGESKIRIEADHIKPLYVILKQYSISSFKQAAECEELWNINNGQTLCHECHRKTDTYGRPKR